MSISDGQRREDKKRTLRLMVETLGDKWFRGKYFQPSDPGFTTVLQTTWRELLDDGLLDDSASAFNSPHFRLTARGWLRGLTYTDAIDSRDLRDRCTRLVRALKSIVKGRNSHYDEFVSVAELAVGTGLPEGWIFNAIEAGLLDVIFPDDRWDAHLDAKSKTTVRVSPTFGLNHLFDND